MTCYAELLEEESLEFEVLPLHGKVGTNESFFEEKSSIIDAFQSGS